MIDWKKWGNGIFFNVKINVILYINIKYKNCKIIFSRLLMFILLKKLMFVIIKFLL